MTVDINAHSCVPESFISTEPAPLLTTDEPKHTVGNWHTPSPKLQALVCDVLPPRRKVAEIDARSVAPSPSLIHSQANNDSLTHQRSRLSSSALLVSYAEGITKTGTYASAASSSLSRPLLTTRYVACLSILPVPLNFQLCRTQFFF